MVSSQPLLFSASRVQPEAQLKVLNVPLLLVESMGVQAIGRSRDEERAYTLPGCRASTANVSPGALAQQQY